MKGTLHYWVSFTAFWVAPLIASTGQPAAKAAAVLPVPVESRPLALTHETASTVAVNDSLSLEARPNDPVFRASRSPDTAPASTVDAFTADSQQPAPQDGNSLDTEAADSTGNFEIFPVGVSVNGRSVLMSTPVRGYEDGSQAVDLKQWQIRFDDVVEALGISLTSLPNNQVELRSSAFVFQVDLSQLSVDEELGRVLSLAEVETLFDVSVQFDILDYALLIQHNWPREDRAATHQTVSEPIITEGLPRVEAVGSTLTFAGQRITVASSADGQTRYRGDLTGLGTIFNGSWFVRLNQPRLDDRRTWFLQEAQYLQQSDQADYVVGSQPTFWQSRGNGNYWGVTTLRRWNYQPNISLGNGGFNPNSRLQADRVGRDIVGEAAPGTLVQLVQGNRTSIVAETLVDSSGVYRFEEVPQGRRYEVLLFPNGQLTAQPEVREASFSTLPSQLPAGASALVVSAGARQTSTQSFLGSFGAASGGVAYRRGVSDDLTLGTALIYDESILGLAELFYQPADLPVQLAVSAIGGEDGVDINADFTYEPSSRVRLDINADALATRFRASWQATSNLRLRITGNSQEQTLGLGLTGLISQPGLFATVTADYRSNNTYQWSGLARFNRFELTTQGNEVGFRGDLLLALAAEPSWDHGNFLRLSHENRQVIGTGSGLTTLGWRHRSRARAFDGRYLWEVDAGYGIGSQGSGWVASVASAVLPGVMLRARYEGVSALSGESSFRFEIAPFYNFQAGMRSSNARYEEMRHQGGLWLRPFIDTNNNGELDANESIVTRDATLLFYINNRPIQASQAEAHSDGLLMRMMPGLYRVDLDPAGYPLYSRPLQTAYAVEVLAGSYTQVLVPFLPFYTVAGQVLDSEDNPVTGAVVEAIHEGSEDATRTTTTQAGIYYLENLEQGRYSLQVNGRLVNPRQLVIRDHSEQFQEINLQVP